MDETRFGTVDLFWDSEEGNLGISHRLLFFLYPRAMKALNPFRKMLGGSSENDLEEYPKFDQTEKKQSSMKNDCSDDLSTIIILLVNGGHELALNHRYDEDDQRSVLCCLFIDLF